jgi:hypothetical protein
MLTLSFLDDLDENKNFADELYTGDIRAITQDEIQERLQRTRQRLAGRCKGLLEIVAGHSHLFFKYQVTFIHRTVREFLAQEDMQKELKKRAGNFNIPVSLCLACLAQIKSFPAKQIGRKGHHDFFYLVDDLVGMAAIAEAKDSKPLLRELETLHNILDAHRDILSSCTEEAEDNSGRIPFWSRHVLSEDDEINLFVDVHVPDEIDFSLIHHAAYIGHFSFVSRMISSSAGVLESKKGAKLIVSASLAAATKLNKFRSRQTVKLTKFLLDHGASPNEPLSGLLKHSTKDSEIPVETPWTLLLLGSIDRVYKSGYPRHICQILEVIEIFLRNGADASICLLGYKVKDLKGKLSVVDSPSYMTLEQLVEIWEPINAEIIRELLQRKSPTRSKNRLNWMTVPFRRGQRNTTPECLIKPLEFDDIQDSYFEVTSIASITCLDKLTLSEIQCGSRITQREEDGIIELVRKGRVNIRVA